METEFEQLTQFERLKEQVEKLQPDEIIEEINYLKLQKNGDTRQKMVHSKGTK